MTGTTPRPDDPLNEAQVDPTILAAVAGYYDRAVTVHGPTPAGVDWNSRESQVKRFDQLLTICPRDAKELSLTDYGCGYGALVEYLDRGDWTFRYQGYDVAEAMLHHARKRWADDERVSLRSDPNTLVRTDYVVASGVFNVKLDVPTGEWETHVRATLDDMAALCRRGFAFNVLSLYSDKERRRPDLYYADPPAWLSYCRDRFSPHVALLHDYGLYEFTLRVRLEI